MPLKPPRKKTSRTCSIVEARPGFRIAGAGPLVGPVLAAQMGYLPGVLWILFGVVLAGADIVRDDESDEEYDDLL
jgi:hypothetical protein